MVNADLTMRINASADKVWNTLSGPPLFEMLLEVYAEKIDMQEGPEGLTIETTFRTGGVVRERVESLDNEERCMRYRVLDAGPLPYVNYRGEARVQPCGADACVVSFQCSFMVVDVSEAEARDYWLEHNRKVLACVQKCVEAA